MGVLQVQARFRDRLSRVSLQSPVPQAHRR
jgi:hypothetical protein